MAKGQLHVLPVVAWAASPSQASSSVSAGTAMEAANVAVMFVAVQQKLSRTHFDDLSSTPPSDPPVAAMRTPGELYQLCLQGCDLEAPEEIAAVAAVAASLPTPDASSCPQEGRTFGASFCLYTVRGGGHVVPQQAYRFPRVLGKTNSALNAPRGAVRFFEHD